MSYWHWYYQAKKTATCTALAWHLEDPLPPVGSLQIITDSHQQPACIIQNTAQFIIRYCDVDADLARQEGEGDLSLDYWQIGHKDFFGRQHCFDPEMWLIFEKFKVIKVL
ncbi:MULTISPECIES: ASCH domain-containing protein [unclassified Acinetobacter]|uniref:ASCH domain-containing protein n=1 Tax=unclassified Acinetobacter TaxID=196816 RepID=UPI0035B9CA32